VLDELWAHDIELPHQYEALEVMAPPLVGLRPDLIAEHLSAFASGRQCWVQAFSEPEAGSDIASLRTRARRDGEGADADFLINGQKVWGSLGTCAQYAFVLARTGTPESRHRGLTMFFLPLDTPGVTVRPIALASGVEHLSEIFFDDARVPASLVLGEVDGGWATLMRILQYERGSYAWLRQAMLTRRLREAVPDVHPRDDRAAQQVGRAYLHALAARAQAARTVGRLGRGETVGAETSVDKVLLGQAEHAVLDVVRELRPHAFLFGDSGELAGWRDLWWYSRATTVFGGAAEVQRGIVADRVLRLPAEGV
jgi:alkylation response protein AidB-like acyl-CoA dehydrogenase